MSSNKTKIIINQHKKNMKVLNAVNYIFLEEINNFIFTKISKYNKSKFIYQKIYNDFILINSLIDNKDFFNSATILRSTYENIMYIIASSYDDNIEIKINTNPKRLRKTVKEKLHLNPEKSIVANLFTKDKKKKKTKKKKNVKH